MVDGMPGEDITANKDERKDTKHYIEGKVVRPSI